MDEASPNSIEEKLKLWKQAKADRDFETADRIRAELRAEGHDPDQPRKRESRESKVRRWKEAKAAKDYVTADQIRMELREEGHDPEPVGSRRDPREDKLERWKLAKSAKDYTLADRLRTELRAEGIDPDRPGNSHGVQLMPVTQPKPITQPLYLPPPIEEPYDARVEAALDEWMEAKEQKDWGKADSIRSRLRRQGYEPDNERPQKGPMTIEELMYHWQRAKQARDFSRSDRLREVLRAEGVDPEGERRGFNAGMGPSQAKDLRDWYDARDRKDWAVADSMRERLRKQGVEPSNCPRPPTQGSAAGYGKQVSLSRSARDAPYSSSKREVVEDPYLENQLDQWWEAKQNKDWSTADAIRSELRSQGIEPDKLRPRR